MFIYFSGLVGLLEQDLSDSVLDAEPTVLRLLLLLRLLLCFHLLFNMSVFPNTVSRATGRAADL